MPRHRQNTASPANQRKKSAATTPVGVTAARNGKTAITPTPAKTHMKNLPVKPTIKFTDLEKIDIRIGTIEKVENVENSDKLVKLTVDFGDFKRSILVGLKKERT